MERPSSSSQGTLCEPPRPTFVCDALDEKQLTTSLPFKVQVRVLDEKAEAMSSFQGDIMLLAISRRTCLAEGFERKALGRWQPASSPLHHESQYSHGFDSEVAAPGSSHSLYLSGGNDANFGMTLKLPATALEAEPPEHSPVAGGGPGESEYEDAAALNGKFQPDAVSFYVRTDNSLADAGHFILGESNEVNRRVAQFQFTRDGKMGLLGTGGTTHGATPYESNRWYHVMLCFDWKRKTVAFSVDGKLLQRSVPFRREASNFIGACALGNRDRCTTWFDSIRFVQETTLNRVAVSIVDGVAETWLGPLGEDEEGRSLAARDGFVLRAEDADGQVSELAGPYHPLCRIEGAQRVAINNAALADFNTLLADDASADVTFVVGGRDVPAHRCILAARCETFRRMFNSSMREGSREEGQRVPIAEVSHAAFSCMLQYIYSGAVAVPEELALELLGLADRYLLEGLKLLCGFTLTRMVSADTVAPILQAADRYDSPSSQLKAHCMQFVLSNYEAVVNSPSFEELTSSPQLLLAVTRAAAKVVAPSGSSRQISWDSDGAPGSKRARHA
ncbi:hypothetical protein EMIHUDRAFT_450242 [Emiliania huxleyi CCMP1516]|uniref:BTB domain-containing protein n=3 Tax=Emiliania huxleyi TaxID=2903 RepID=A0A0D3JS39_EMIH1|nr:hypothetical protein EMIHUDRAFT_450242 [Emiliania huxleyi CCMP1516]EOD26324.1 hypothetical protein EMIHUDRAFT_450242 [Emiliania huxleyi CCMP1516]|eukprot:XP_005778753.1 hypothetical protein EMIHUDRAFT_450242 [Emiliania huxleyi CCMP1516]